jgi:polysaccharide biosynthesis PFTS motif protein
VFIVAKEYIFDELVYQALDNSLDLILTTQSTHNYQPLIFELDHFRGKKIMLWYSTNSMPLEFKEDSEFRWIQNEDIFRFMHIDTHWVWTKEHKNYLSSLTNVEVIVKGTLMLYLDSQKSLDKFYDITIFDVTPKTGRHSLDTIYNGDYARKFLSEIVTAATVLKGKRSRKINIALKSKRSYKGFCEPTYSLLLDFLVKSKVIDILPPETNAFELIRSSSVVIVYPFSSPAVIGREMNVPTIFYEPGDYLVKVDEKYGVPVVSSLNQLIEFLSKEINK